MTTAAARATGRERAFVALWFAVCVGLLLRPTPGWIAETLPDNPGDTSLVIWIMSWGWQGLRDPLDLFHANIFWPHEYTYAYNDTLLALVGPYALLRAVFGMVAALNLLVLALFVLDLVATYLLARHVGANVPAAAIAASAFSFGAYPMSPLGHVNLLAFGFVPLALLAFLRVLEQPRPGRVALTVLASAAAFTCSAYYGVMLAVAFAATAAVHLLRPQEARQRVGRLGAIVAVGAGVLLLLSPVLVSYLKVRDLGLKRDPSEVNVGSLDWRDLGAPAIGNKLAAPRLAGKDNPIERRMFPGVFGIVFGLVGLGAMVVPAARGRLDQVRPWSVASLALAGVALVVLAAGRFVFGRRGPFGVLQDHVPGFDAVRVPARLAAVTVLAIVVVASLGLTFVTVRLGARGRWAVLALVAAFVLAESATTLVHAPLDDGPAFTAPYRILDCAREGVVLELPIADVSTVAGAILEAPREALGTIDWNRRVNGYTGFIPPGFQDDRATLLRFPDDIALDRARELDVRYVVVHYGSRNGVEIWSREHAEAIVQDLDDPSVAVRAGHSFVVPLDEGAAADVARCAS